MDTKAGKPFPAPGIVATLADRHHAYEFNSLACKEGSSPSNPSDAGRGTGSRPRGCNLHCLCRRFNIIAGSSAESIFGPFRGVRL